MKSIEIDDQGRVAFGKAITALMRERQLTYRQVACASGLATMTVDMLAHGYPNKNANRLSIFVVVGLADALGVHPDTLIKTFSQRLVAAQYLEDGRKKNRMRIARVIGESELDKRPISLPTPTPLQDTGLAVPSASAIMLKVRGLSEENRILINEFIDEVVAG
jgi:transcriptional regulator with XRE-family HTH domain